nr:tetratricopeptide repeat protein [Clostridium estertheticum]
MWRNKDRYNNALIDYNTVIELEPRNKKYYVARANLLTDIFEEDLEALNDYLLAFELDPNDDKVCSLIGNMYSLLNDDENSIKYYKLALKLNSQNYEVWYSLGSAYDVNDKVAEAIECYTTVINGDKHQNHVYYDRGSCYYRNKMYEKALMDLEMFIQLGEPENERTYFLRGNIYECLGNFEEALKEYKKVLSINREDYILDRIVQLYRKFKDVNLLKDEINGIIDGNKINSLSKPDKELVDKQESDIKVEENRDNLNKKIIVYGNITIKDEEKSISIKDLNEFEEYIGNILPEEYRRFILQCNGGKLNPYKFITKDKFIKSCAMNLLPLSNNKMPNIKEKYEIFNKGDLIPKNLLAIVMDPTESPICICLKGKNIGKIYYWNSAFEKDFVKPSYKNMHLVADNFDEFISGLYV